MLPTTLYLSSCTWRSNSWHAKVFLEYSTNKCVVQSGGDWAILSSKSKLSILPTRWQNHQLWYHCNDLLSLLSQPYYWLITRDANGGDRTLVLMVEPVVRWQYDRTLVLMVEPGVRWQYDTIVKGHTIWEYDHKSFTVWLILPLRMSVNYSLNRMTLIHYCTTSKKNIV